MAVKKPPEAPEITSPPRKATGTTKIAAKGTRATRSATRLLAKPGMGGGLAPPRKTPLAQLQEYPGNARIGDVDSIAESLKKTGQYKPIIVQASTSYVIAGNHTMKAAHKIGWKTLDALFLDVDDQTAARINLIDNRSNDKATYDTVALAEQLRKIDSFQGTGYSDVDVQSILSAIEDRNAELISEVLHPVRAVDFEGALDDDERLDRMQKDYEDKPWASDDPNKELSDEELERQLRLSTLQHNLEGLKDMVFPQENYWGIPTFKRDMLMDSIPEPIDTWAGQDVTPDDGIKHWIWNFGLAASKGLPWERAILAGFTYDTKFISLWEDPEFQFARLLNNGLKYAIVPDFSFWENDPRFLNLQALYRAQWVGRAMQEVGIKIIPRIMWRDPESLKWALEPLPVKAPVLAMCFQAADPKYHDDPRNAEMFRNIVKQLQPEALLIYAGPPGKRLVERALIPKSIHVVIVDNYAAKRRGVAYDRKEGKMSPALKRKPNLNGDIDGSDDDGEE